MLVSGEWVRVAWDTNFNGSINLKTTTINKMEEKMMSGELSDDSEVSLVM